MTEMQAFEILRKQGGLHRARVVLRGILGEKKSLSWREAARVRHAARALARGVPVAKIIGRKWFYGMAFETNKHTLDPRPDSETVVDAVLSDLGDHAAVRLLDMGTGTGCLIGAIVKNCPNASGIGIDKSCRAIRVARRNIRRLGLSSRVHLHYGTFRAPRATPGAGRFDLIVSNPPYIAAGDKRVNRGALHDPRGALFAGADGLAAYRVIAKTAGPLLKPGGKIYLEIGVGMARDVRNIFEKAGFEFIAARNDLSAIERVLVLGWKG